MKGDKKMKYMIEILKNSKFSKDSIITAIVEDALEGKIIAECKGKYNEKKILIFTRKDISEIKEVVESINGWDLQEGPESLQYFTYKFGEGMEHLTNASYSIKNALGSHQYALDNYLSYHNDDRDEVLEKLKELQSKYCSNFLGEERDTTDTLLEITEIIKNLATNIFVARATMCDDRMPLLEVFSDSIVYKTSGGLRFAIERFFSSSVPYYNFVIKHPEGLFPLFKEYSTLFSSATDMGFYPNYRYSKNEEVEELKIILEEEGQR